MGKITDDALLVQLGYTVTSGTREMLKNIIKNTRGYEELKSRLLSLQKKLEPYGSFVGLSSSKNFFKIKNENNSKEVYSLVESWSKKYKVNLVKVNGGQTYYIK